YAFCCDLTNLALMRIEARPFHKVQKQSRSFTQSPCPASVRLPDLRLRFSQKRRTRGGGERKPQSGCSPGSPGVTLQESLAIFFRRCVGRFVPRVRCVF